MSADGEKMSREVTVTSCTADDFAKFETPERRSRKRFEALQKQISVKEENAETNQEGDSDETEPASGLICIDWAEQGVDLWGYSGDSTAESGTLDVQVLPCHVKETLLGGTEDRIPAICNRDQQTSIDYIGPMQMVAIYNEG